MVLDETNDGARGTRRRVRGVARAARGKNGIDRQSADAKRARETRAALITLA